LSAALSSAMAGLVGIVWVERSQSGRCGNLSTTNNGALPGCGKSCVVASDPAETCVQTCAVNRPNAACLQPATGAMSHKTPILPTSATHARISFPQAPKGCKI
jgi:hypothetical protein